MSQHESNVEAIAAQNQKLGQFPVVTMADGTKAPTGSVAMLLHNIRTYDQAVLSKGGEDTSAGGVDKKELEEQMAAVVPVLMKIGLFDLFSPEEWMAGDKSPGRKFVGSVARNVRAKGESG